MGKMCRSCRCRDPLSRPFRRRVNGEAEEERPAFVIVERIDTTEPRLFSKSTPSLHAKFSPVRRPLSTLAAGAPSALKVMGLHPVAWQYCPISDMDAGSKIAGMTGQKSQEASRCAKVVQGSVL